LASRGFVFYLDLCMGTAIRSWQRRPADMWQKIRGLFGRRVPEVVKEAPVPLWGPLPHVGRMKWYFAMSEASIRRDDHDWADLMRVAVRSAQRNTSLVPHMLYDGQPNDFTKEMKDAGVTVIHHRVSFYDKIAEYAAAKNNPWHLAIAAGAFLRIEIPLIEKDDEFVLYTDCDVQFMCNPDLSRYRPEWFAAAPQTSLGDYDDMNSGVMLMNVPAMRRDMPRFLAFINEKLELGWLDQDVLRDFYKGRYTAMEPTLNWKPYWGMNRDAQIVHWHGPKPVVAKRLSLDAQYHSVVPAWDGLLHRSRDGYVHYVSSWEAMRDQQSTK
jgi:hypothetical protein